MRKTQRFGRPLSPHQHLMSETMASADTLSRCFGKHAFTSPTLAFKVARRGEGAKAYRCPDCGKWHIGHRVRTAHGKRRPA